MADAVETTAPGEPKRLSWSMLSRLSGLNFLQFAIWGAWYSVFGAFMLAKGFTNAQVGWAYALLPLACIIAPFIAGQIADRWMSTQMFLAGAHLVGGIALLFCAAAFDHLQGTRMLIWMFVWSLTYGSTLGLVNSLCFHHLPSGEKDFGKVRVWGTIAWILIGVAFTVWLSVGDPAALPSFEIFGVPLLGWLPPFVGWIGAAVASLTGHAPDPQTSDCLRFAGWISIFMGAYCLTLPRTPPKESGEKPWAFVEAFKLLKDWHFAVFLGISFLVSTELVFYYSLTGPFLTSVGVAEANVSAVMTIGQIAEILTLAAVGWFLPKLGIKWSLAIGILAWPLRYAIFAIGSPKWLMIAALPLHGVCFVCFFVVAFIYVDKVATPDIRASAQSLLNFVLYGIGMFLGAHFSGLVKGVFTTDGVTNWTKVFLVPVVITTACAILFFVSFQEPREEPEAA